MRKSRFTEEQIVAILKESDVGVSNADICRKHGISDQTFYKWRQKYGGMQVSDVKRMKSLEEENATLKRLLGQKELENSAMKAVLEKKMVILPQKRMAVEVMVAADLSERAACVLVRLNRSICRYESAKREDTELRAQVVALAHAHRRFGYRRIHAKVRKLGFSANHKKIYRIYCEEKLKLRRTKSKKLTGFTGAPMCVASGPNEQWSLDFVSDMLLGGRRFRSVNVVDDYTRECVGMEVDFRLPAQRVRALDRMIWWYGKPKAIRSDIFRNGHDKMTLTGVSLSPASQCKMPSPSHSMADFVMNVSMTAGSQTSRRHVILLENGGTITIQTDRMAHWATTR